MDVMIKYVGNSLDKVTYEELIHEVNESAYDY